MTFKFVKFSNFAPPLLYCLSCLIGLGLLPLATQGQTTLGSLFQPGPAYPDPYSSVFLSVGSRRFAHEAASWEVRYRDESAMPMTFALDFDLEERSRNTCFWLGYETGDYTGPHFEFAASWSHTDQLDLSTFGVGVGRNYPFMGGQMIVRPVIALMYGNMIQRLPDITVSTLNLTVNDTDYPQDTDLDVHLRARVLEARPRIDVLYRVYQGVAIRAQVGFDLAMNLHPGFLRLRGEALNEEPETERESTNEANVAFRRDGDLISEVRFPDYGLSGLSFGLGLTYNFKAYDWKTYDW